MTPGWLVPKQFLCRYPLRTGAIVASAVLIVVSIICVIALIVQVILMQNCVNCTRYVWRNAYGFSITGVFYCFIMLILHFWVLWGIKQRKASVLLSWVVVTTMWLSQTLFLLITLICLYSADVKFVAWILSLLFGLFAISILVYLVFIVYGFYTELKCAQRSRNNARRDSVAN